MLRQEEYKIACPSIIEIEELKDEHAAWAQRLEARAHRGQQQWKNGLFLRIVVHREIEATVPRKQVDFGWICGDEIRLILVI